jgi:hypothetical protein
MTDDNETTRIFPRWRYYYPECFRIKSWNDIFFSEEHIFSDTIFDLNPFLKRKVQNKDISKLLEELENLFQKRTKLLSTIFPKIQLVSLVNFIKLIFVYRFLTEFYFTRYAIKESIWDYDYDHNFIIREIVKYLKSEDIKNYDLLNNEINLKVLKLDYLKIQNGFEIPEYLIFNKMIDDNCYVIRRTSHGNRSVIDFSFYLSDLKYISKATKKNESDILDEEEIRKQIEDAGIVNIGEEREIPPSKPIKEIKNIYKNCDTHIRVKSTPHESIFSDFSSITYFILIPFYKGIASGDIYDKASAEKLLKDNLWELGDSIIEKYFFPLLVDQYYNKAGIPSKSSKIIASEFYKEFLNFLFNVVGFSKDTVGDWIYKGMV